MDKTPIYFNNAATSYPKPPEVADAVATCIASVPHDAHRGSSEDGVDIVEVCRKSIARLFGVADSSTVIFTSSATEGLNLLAFGSRLEGGHVIATAAEHNSVIRPLKTIEKRGSIAVTFAPCDGSGRVDPVAIEKSISTSTRAVFVTHASNVTGAINDIGAISEIAQRNGLLLFVDASQSAGNVPIDISTWNADGVVFAGHKGLYGIAGVGVVILKAGLDLEPLKVGGTGSRSDLLLQPTTWPARFEAGTANLPGIAALHAGVEFVLRERIPQTDPGTTPVNLVLEERLPQIPGVRMYGCQGLDKRLPIWTLGVNNMDPGDCAFILQSAYGIITRAGLHCAPLIHQALGSFPAGSVRISPSYFTTMEDATRLLDALACISVGYGRNT